MTSTFSRLRKLYKSSIQLKMLLAIAAPIFLATTLSMAFVFSQTSQDSLELLKENNLRQADATASYISVELRELEDLVALMTGYVSSIEDISPDELYSLIQGNLGANPLIFGSAIAFEPFSYDQQTRLFSPYAYRDGDNVMLMDIGEINAGSGYDYTNGEWEWWSSPRASGNGLWTMPYFDEGAGNVLMSTYSQPFYDGDQFRGVITADILLESIFAQLGLDSDNEYIVTSDGTIIYSSHPDEILGTSLLDIDRPEGTENLADIIESANNRLSEVAIFSNSSGQEFWGIHSTIPETGWIYLNLLPARTATVFITNQQRMFATGLFITWIILAIMVWFITRKITRPVMTLNTAAQQVADGVYDVSLPQQSGDEIGQLSDRFGDMIQVLARKNADWQQQLDARTTELTISQANLEAQKDLIEKALDGIDIGILMYNSNCDILAINGKLGVVIGMDSAQVESFTNVLTFSKVLATEKLKKSVDDDRIREKLFVSRPCQELLELSDGRVLERKCSPITNDIYINSFEDVTERNNHKRELEHRLEELDNSKRATLNMMQDVEESRKKIELSEMELKEQLHFIQALMDTLPNPIFYKGPDTRFIGFNKAYEETFGIRSEDLVGKCVLDLDYLPEEDRKRYQAEDEHVISTVGSLRYEIRMPFADGKEHVTLYWVNGFRQSDGSPGGLIGTFIDITEQKEIAQQLEIAKEEAEAATEAKANFLASMSHEIRTPMNAVIGMVDLLRQTELTDEQQEMLATVSMSGQSLLTIINDILDISKIESGRFELEKIPFSLTNTMEGAIKTVSVNAQAKALGLLTYIDPAIPDTVKGDSVRIRQILINLVGNAIKFTERENILIRADKLALSDDEVTIRFSVKDKGIGISKDAQKSLFQEFSQAESSTTRKYGGTGLGLSICKRLTEMMGGKIGLHSELGKGSEFYFELTLPVEQQAAHAEPINFEGVRVLLVESDSEEASILKGYLEHWQMTVDINDSLEDSARQCRKEAAENTPYDIVIIGSHWPRREKFALAENAGAGNCPTRFIALAVGKRRKPRIQTENTLTLDIVPFTGTLLCDTVAIALGRESPSVHMPDEPVIEAASSSLSIAEAEQAGTLILVAEDNPTNRDVIGRQLKLLGHTFEMAENGSQALDAWQSGRFSLLLTDCHMPIMDGFALTAAIRQDEIRNNDPTRRRFPIIAVTANALQGEAERCLAAGMDGYLSKPIDMKALQKTLNDYITLPESPKSEPAPREQIPPGKDAPKGNTTVDISVLKDMFGDDDELVREIMTDFISPSEQIVTEIHDALASGSAEDLKQSAHKLKSAARSIGANDLADTCEKLEHAGADGEMEVAAELAPSLDNQMSAVISDIRKL